jgi:hypothetical protein
MVGFLQTVDVAGFILPNIKDIGAGTLVILVVLMILTGRLVPGKERDYWREMALEEQRQKRELIDAGKVTQQVLRAIPPALEGEGKS